MNFILSFINNIFDFKFFHTIDFICFCIFSMFVCGYFFKKSKYLMLFFYVCMFFFVFYFIKSLNTLSTMRYAYVIIYFLFLHYIYILRLIVISYDNKINDKIFILLIVIAVFYGLMMIFNCDDIGAFFVPLFISSLSLFCFFFLYCIYSDFVYKYFEFIMPYKFLAYYSYFLYTVFFISVCGLILFNISMSNIFFINFSITKKIVNFIDFVSFRVSLYKFFIILWFFTFPFVLYFLDKMALKVVYSLQLNNVDRFHTLSGLYKSVFKSGYIIICFLIFCGTENLKSILPSIAFSFMAIKDLVFGFVNAFLILTEDSVNIGEFVEIAGVSGKIEEISLRYIKLRDFEGSLFIVPFYKVETIKNRGKDFVYVVLNLNVSINEDVNRIIFLMKEAFFILKKNPEYDYLKSNFLESIEVIGLTYVSSVYMSLEARIKIRPFNTRMIKASYYKVIKDLFEKEGIELSYDNICLYESYMNKKS